MKINLREIGKAPTLVVLNEMIDKFKRINGVDPVLVMNCKTWFKFIDIQTLNWWGDGNKESLPEGYLLERTDDAQTFLTGDFTNDKTTSAS